uniref:Uncharacterized protein n=1 Tax=Aegilops tauschii subsp. strangulata TaxID=200361 RepID=A0A452YHS4_AEGTS
MIHLIYLFILSAACRMILFSCVQKTMTQGKEYCERKINLLKSNFDELLEMATKKKSIADEMGMFLQAKLRQASPSSSS